jgi:serine/threonine protein kinase
LRNNTKIDFISDFWSLGVLTYELLIGCPPFYFENFKIIEELILNNEVQYPDFLKINESCKRFISSLLTKNPKNRLGSNNGLQEIKSSTWLKEVFFDEANFLLLKETS